MRLSRLRLLSTIASTTTSTTASSSAPTIVSHPYLDRLAQLRRAFLSGGAGNGGGGESNNTGTGTGSSSPVSESKQQQQQQQQYTQYDSRKKSIEDKGNRGSGSGGGSENRRMSNRLNNPGAPTARDRKGEIRGEAIALLRGESKTVVTTTSTTSSSPSTTGIAGSGEGAGVGLGLGGAPEDGATIYPFSPETVSQFLLHSLPFHPTSKEKIFEESVLWGLKHMGEFNFRTIVPLIQAFAQSEWIDVISVYDPPASTEGEEATSTTTTGDLKKKNLADLGETAKTTNEESSSSSPGVSTGTNGNTNRRWNDNKKDTTSPLAKRRCAFAYNVILPALNRLLDEGEKLPLKSGFPTKEAERAQEDATPNGNTSAEGENSTPRNQDEYVEKKANEGESSRVSSAESGPVLFHFYDTFSRSSSVALIQVLHQCADMEREMMIIEKLKLQQQQDEVSVTFSPIRKQSYQRTTTAGRPGIRGSTALQQQQEEEVTAALRRESFYIFGHQYLHKVILPVLATAYLDCIARNKQGRGRGKNNSISVEDGEEEIAFLDTLDDTCIWFRSGIRYYTPGHWNLLLSRLSQLRYTCKLNHRCPPTEKNNEIQVFLDHKNARQAQLSTVLFLFLQFHVKSLKAAPSSELRRYGLQPFRSHDICDMLQSLSRIRMPRKELWVLLLERLIEGGGARLRGPEVFVAITALGQRSTTTTTTSLLSEDDSTSSPGAASLTMTLQEEKEKVEKDRQRATALDQKLNRYIEEALKMIFVRMFPVVKNYRANEVSMILVSLSRMKASIPMEILQALCTQLESNLHKSGRKNLLPFLMALSRQPTEALEKLRHRNIIPLLTKITLTLKGIEATLTEEDIAKLSNLYPKILLISKYERYRHAVTSNKSNSGSSKKSEEDVVAVLATSDLQQQHQEKDGQHSSALSSEQKEPLPDDDDDPQHVALLLQELQASVRVLHAMLEALSPAIRRVIPTASGSTAGSITTAIQCVTRNSSFLQQQRQRKDEHLTSKNKKDASFLTESPATAASASVAHELKEKEQLSLDSSASSQQVIELPLNKTMPTTTATTKEDTSTTTEHLTPMPSTDSSAVVGVATGDSSYSLNALEDLRAEASQRIQHAASDRSNASAADVLRGLSLLFSDPQAETNPVATGSCRISTDATLMPTRRNKRRPSLWELGPQMVRCINDVISTATSYELGSMLRICLRIQREIELSEKKKEEIKNEDNDSASILLLEVKVAQKHILSELANHPDKVKEMTVADVLPLLGTLAKNEIYAPRSSSSPSIKEKEEEDESDMNILLPMEQHTRLYNHLLHHIQENLSKVMTPREVPLLYAVLNRLRVFRESISDEEEEEEVIIGQEGGESVSIKATTKRSNEDKTSSITDTCRNIGEEEKEEEAQNVRMAKAMLGRTLITAGDMSQQEILSSVGQVARISALGKKPSTSTTRSVSEEHTTTIITEGEEEEEERDLLAPNEKNELNEKVKAAVCALVSRLQQILFPNENLDVDEEENDTAIREGSLTSSSSSDKNLFPQLEPNEITALAQSLARISFFFSRTETEEGDEDHYYTTLANVLYGLIPNIREKAELFTTQQASVVLGSYAKLGVWHTRTMRVLLQTASQHILNAQQQQEQEKEKETTGESQTPPPSLSQTKKQFSEVCATLSAIARLGLLPEGGRGSSSHSSLGQQQQQLMDVQNDVVILVQALLQRLRSLLEDIQRNRQEEENGGEKTHRNYDPSVQRDVIKALQALRSFRSLPSPPPPPQAPSTSSSWSQQQQQEIVPMLFQALSFEKEAIASPKDLIYIWNCSKLLFFSPSSLSSSNATQPHTTTASSSSMNVNKNTTIIAEEDVFSTSSQVKLKLIPHVDRFIEQLNFSAVENITFGLAELITKTEKMHSTTLNSNNKNNSQMFTELLERLLGRAVEVYKDATPLSTPTSLPPIRLVRLYQLSVKLFLLLDNLNNNNNNACNRSNKEDKDDDEKSNCNKTSSSFSSLQVQEERRGKESVSQKEEETLFLEKLTKRCVEMLWLLHEKFYSSASSVEMLSERSAAAGSSNPQVPLHPSSRGALHVSPPIHQWSAGTSVLAGISDMLSQLVAAAAVSSFSSPSSLSEVLPLEEENNNNTIHDIEIIPSVLTPSIMEERTSETMAPTHRCQRSRILSKEAEEEIDLLLRRTFFSFHHHRRTGKLSEALRVFESLTKWYIFALEKGKIILTGAELLVPFSSVVSSTSAKATPTSTSSLSPRSSSTVISSASASAGENHKDGNKTQPSLSDEVNKKSSEFKKEEAQTEERLSAAIVREEQECPWDASSSAVLFADLSQHFIRYETTLKSVEVVRILTHACLLEQTLLSLTKKKEKKEEDGTIRSTAGDDANLQNNNNNCSQQEHQLPKELYEVCDRKFVNLLRTFTPSDILTITLSCALTLNELSLCPMLLSRLATKVAEIEQQQKPTADTCYCGSRHPSADVIHKEKGKEEEEEKATGSTNSSGSSWCSEETKTELISILEQIKCSDGLAIAYLKEK